jgi:UPF0716 protein FxsA
MLIFLLLVAVPIIEIGLFIQVGGWLGLWPTIAIVILTAAIGTVLLRAQGLAALGELQRQMGAGEDPSATLAHGAMILVAGVLLLTPGFFTDGVGFLLLTPPMRAVAIRLAIRLGRSRMTRVHMKVHVSAGGRPGRAGPGVGTGSRAGTVEGEYEVVDPKNGGPENDGSGGGSPPGGSGRTRLPGDRRGR